MNQIRYSSVSLNKTKKFENKINRALEYHNIFY